MTYSLLITALIIGIAAFLGHSQNEKLHQLRAEWLEIRATGSDFDIPEDPETEFSPTRLAERKDKRIRKEAVVTFSEEITSYMKEMKEARKNGNGNDPAMQERGMDLFLQLTEFSGGEVKYLIDLIMADSTLEEQSKSEMVMGSLMFLSNEQPEIALAILLETKGKILKDKNISNHVTGIALGKLAAGDPLTALNWMKDHQDDLGGIDDDLRREVLSGAAQKDLLGAFSLMREMKFEKTEKPYWALVQNVTTENANIYLAGVRGLDADPKELEKALGALTDSPLWKDHAAAATWIEQAELTDEESKSIMNGLHYHSAKEEISSWLDWLDEKDTPEYAGKSKQLMRQWAYEDFRAAGEWVNGLEKGARRDEAAYQYASALKDHEPEAAREWAQSLPNGAQKNELLDQIKARE